MHWPISGSVQTLMLKGKLFRKMFSRINDYNSYMGFIVFVIIILIIFFSHTLPESVNEKSRLALIESILKHNVVWTDHSIYLNFFDMIFRNGHYYSDKPPLLALYSLFFTLPINELIDINSKTGKAIFYYWITITSSGTALIIIYHIFNKLAEIFKIENRIRNWSFLGLILGTCLLPYFQVYNDHIICTAITFTLLYVLVLYRLKQKRSLILVSGLLVGMCFLIHPFPGIISSVSTLLYFLRSHVKNVLSYFAGVSCVILIGLVIHFFLYGTFKPFYFSPEYYFYTITYKQKKYLNIWFKNPAQPGLTEEKLISRCKELNMSDKVIKETVHKLRDYKKSIKNPIAFMLKRLIEYDYLIFNPLVIFCIVLLMRLLCLREFFFRFEFLWAALTILGMYFGAVFLRSFPGGSFGNRHLIPILPLIVFSSSIQLKEGQNLDVFKILFWFSFASILPGTFAPWKIPNLSYQIVNICIYVILIVYIMAYFILNNFNKRIFTPYISTMTSRVLIVTGLAALFVGEIIIFYHDSITSIVQPRIFIYMCIAIILYALNSTVGKKHFPNKK
ncbi:hypothetical protein ACFL20_12100 [Spirochaetota bacterium]